MITFKLIPAQQSSSNEYLINVNDSNYLVEVYDDLTSIRAKINTNQYIQIDPVSGRLRHKHCNLVLHDLGDTQVHEIVATGGDSKPIMENKRAKINLTSTSYNLALTLSMLVSLCVLGLYSFYTTKLPERKQEPKVKFEQLLVFNKLRLAKLQDLWSGLFTFVSKYQRPTFKHNNWFNH